MSVKDEKEGSIVCTKCKSADSVRYHPCARRYFCFKCGSTVAIRGIELEAA
jgi:uncharacterized OB-fold protein